METVTKKEEKQEIKELVHALQHHKGNRPVCDNCGEHFDPEPEEMTVEFPREDEAPPHASRTSFVEKPDYCSTACEVADAL